MKRSLIALAFAAALVLTLVPLKQATADPGSMTFQYLLGTGILCGLGPTACPDKAMASFNGDIIEIAGEGVLTIHPKTVTGGGTFVHKDSAGNIIASGNWTAEELLSFNLYPGTDPNLPPTFRGGTANIKVRLWPSGGGPSLGAILKVECTIGNTPGGAIEGIRLTVQDGLNFNQEVSGFTVFIMQ